MDSTKTLDLLIADYERVRGQIQELNNQSDELKAAIIGIVGSKPEGTLSKSFDNLTVSTTASITRTINDKALCESKERLIASLGRDTFDELFTYKPRLNLSAFRKLKSEQLIELMPIVTAKQGATSLKIKLNEATNDR